MREPPEIPNVTPIRKNSMGYPVAESNLGPAVYHGSPPDPSGNHNHRIYASKPQPDPGLTPYGYLMEVLRDTDADPYLRVMAAEILMPYCHKKE